MQTTNSTILIKDRNHVEILLTENEYPNDCVEILTEQNSHLHTQLRMSKYFIDPDGIFSEREVKVMGQIILHHFTEEDRKLIPKLKVQLTPADLKRMGNAYVRDMGENIFSMVS